MGRQPKELRRPPRLKPKKNNKMRFLVASLALFSLLFGAGLPASALTDGEIEKRRAELEAELAREELQIEAAIQLLQVKQREGATLQGDVDLLQAQIARARASIKAKQAQIDRLEDEIYNRSLKIEDLNITIERQKESLSELLRQTKENQRISLVEIVLANDSLTEFFNDVDDFNSIQESVHTSFANMRGLQDEARQEQETLAAQKAKEVDAKQVVEEEEQRTKNLETDKKRLLNITKNQEKNYQKLLEERSKRAAEIRGQLFALRDTAAIPFGKALEYANLVEQKTGVRPAFLLAIIEQESKLGENIGTCNRPGDPPSKSWREIMKPSRDQGPFLRITKALGLNPDTLPLSCPYGGGWGGAMGPAQFIPSTWELVQADISRLLGKATPNPWEPFDAFMASGFYLAKLGAAGGGYTAERTAALKYYAGGNWNKSKNAFYGDQVMARARRIQLEMIEPLQDV